MVKKINKFSAFKLFYDEFVYKSDSNVKNVSRNIEIIKNEVMKVRKASKSNLDTYQLILDRANKRIRIQLNEIYELNSNVFEYYYYLYKTRVTISSDQIKDMPFVVSCSFYDDYRLDDKSVEELETSSYVIPAYNSLEKKEIRLEAQDKSRLTYFVQLLRNSSESYRFDKLFCYLDTMLSELKPVKESHYDYFMRINQSINLFEHIYRRVINKINGTDLGNEIQAKMEIAFRKKVTLDVAYFKEILLEHFDHVYHEYEENNELVKKYMMGNLISYESYKDIVNEYIREKNQLMEQYDKGIYDTYVNYDTSDISRFKTILIRSYFDGTYSNHLDLLSSEEDYANRAIELYSLADTLVNQLFEKVLFNSSHSKDLGRNGDANSALLEKLYSLYDPFDLIERFESTRKKFELSISKKGNGFYKEYLNLLNNKKISKNYHGPIPNKEILKLRLEEKCASFLYEKCITELVNRNTNGNYDTRNYDLNVVASYLSVDLLIDTYQKMKYKISSFDFQSLRFVDSVHGEDEYEKEELLKHLQYFVAHNILIKLKYGKLTKEQEDNRLNDICYSYLKEKCLFVLKKGNLSKKNYRESFDSSYDAFVLNSSWYQLLDKYKIKR